MVAYYRFQNYAKIGVKVVVLFCLSQISKLLIASQKNVFNIALSPDSEDSEIITTNNKRCMLKVKKI